MFISNHAWLALAFVCVAASTATAQEPWKDRYGDLLPPDATARIGTVRLRSADDIDRVCLSPDGKLLITTRDYCPLQVWDAVTGSPIRTIAMVQYPYRRFRDDEDRLVSEEVATMAFTSDSRRLHVLTRNGLLRMCDLASRKWSEPLARVAGPLPDDTSYCFGSASPDGTHFAFTPKSKPYRIEIFAVGKDKPILVLKHEKFSEWGRGCAFSADNKVIAFGLKDHSIEVRELATNRFIATCKEPDLELHHYALSPDGSAVTALYYSKGDDRKLGNPFTLVTWDATTGKERFRDVGWKGYLVGHTPDGTKLLARHAHEIVVADAATGKVTNRWKAHGLAGPWGFHLSQDGMRLVTSGGRDRSAIIWELATGKPVLDLDAPRGPVCVIAFSPDGKTLFTGSTQEHPGWVWDVETGKRKQLLVADGKGHPTSAAFTADGLHVIVGYGWGGDGVSTATKLGRRGSGMLRRARSFASFPATRAGS